METAAIAIANDTDRAIDTKESTSTAHEEVVAVDEVWCVVYEYGGVTYREGRNK